MPVRIAVMITKKILTITSLNLFHLKFIYTLDFITY
jgi:hypothetical protein